MPFTLSHAVVALPFRRSVLIPSAIAIGAMVPDLPLFFPIFPLREAYWVTHSWWGIFTLDLALAAMVFLAWRVLLRPVVSALSPRWIRARIPEVWDRAQLFVSQRRVIGGVLFVCSLLLGSVTHVVWDLFTHPARAGTEWLPFLAHMWGPLPGYDWAQYASSVLGLLILAVWMIATFRAREITVRRSRMPRRLAAASWALAATLPLLIAAIDFWRHGVPASMSGFVFRVGVPAMALDFALLLAVSVTHFILELQRDGRAQSVVRGQVE